MVAYENMKLADFNCDPVSLTQTHAHIITRLTLKQYPLGAMVYSYTYAEFQLSNHIFIILKYTVSMEHVYQIQSL